MATKSTEATEKVTKTNDPWSDMVEVKIPKAVNGEPNYVIASVNGRIFKVQRGIKVEVPAPIAEVLEHSFEARDEADEFIESLTSK